MTPKLGQTIRDLRKSKELTLNELSELTDISISHLSLIEREKREPSITYLKEISGALSLSPSILILMSTDLRELSGTAKEITKQLKGVLTSCMESDSDNTS